MATTPENRNEPVTFDSPVVQRALAKAARREHKIAFALGVTKVKPLVRRKTAAR